MPPLNEQEKAPEYRITDKLVVQDEPIEVELSTMDRYRTNSSSRQGEEPKRVRSGGTAASVGRLSDEWSDILPGVEGRMITSTWSDGRRGGLTKTYTIRVHPEACPVLIEVDQVQTYTSQYQNGFVDGHYAVSVVKPEPAGTGFIERIRGLLPKMRRPQS